MPFSLRIGLTKFWLWTHRDPVGRPGTPKLGRSWEHCVPSPQNTALCATTKWSGIAGFGWTGPQRHVENRAPPESAKRISLTGTSPNRIGALPAGARPTRDVVLISTPSNCTYAHLADRLLQADQIIPPPPPAVEDLTFVSLEEITYQLEL